MQPVTSLAVPKQNASEPCVASTRSATLIPLGMVLVFGGWVCVVSNFVLLSIENQPTCANATPQIVEHTALRHHLELAGYIANFPAGFEATCWFSLRGVDGWVRCLLMQGVHREFYVKSREVLEPGLRHGYKNLTQGFRARVKKGRHTFSGPVRKTRAAAVDDERQYKVAGGVSLERVRELHETLHRPLVHVRQRGDSWRARIMRGGEYHLGPYRIERKVAEADARLLLQSVPRAAGGLSQELRGAELVDRRGEGFEAAVRLHFQFLLSGDFSGMSGTEQRRLRRARQEDKYKAAFEACKLLVEDKRAIEKLALEHDGSWMHRLGVHFCLDYGSRPLGTGGFDVPSGQCGLCNLGNSCWLNATVQCFISLHTAAKGVVGCGRW